ncbi:protein preY, mitochondrial-like [Callorhinchus milii]|uniref:protein preY, mitochondrial-like n=1 Tax=Callorhinchus milii TaxID=7868 RepID=UPI001C3F6508|nr:protein preY, mitochondrial-like [Callorhinchus milii]
MLRAGWGWGRLCHCAGVAGGPGVGSRRLVHVTPDPSVRTFDISLLTCLVCPLSRRPLRYAEDTNQLINDELGIAYPIVDGIPNMIPQDARLIRRTEDMCKEDSQK